MPFQLKRHFQFAKTKVQILEGEILSPGVDVHFLVSTDDNYLTMGSGVSAALREKAGPKYIREAQDQCPVVAGTVVVTGAHDLRQEPLQHLQSVLHATVVDYDSEALALERLVYQATANCLHRAEELIQETADAGRDPAEWSILFPALGTGSGRLSMDACARQMCASIKAYLTSKRPLKRIYIILYDDPDQEKENAAANKEFLASANRVLDTPNDPVAYRPRTEDIWVRTADVQQLSQIIAGESPQGLRHSIVLGGLRIGKSLFLDQVLERAGHGDDQPGQNQMLVRLSFGRLHSNTPASFIYQKLLHALCQGEQDPILQEAIRTTYAEIGALASLVDDRKIAEQSSLLFLNFLDEFPDRFRKIVFFVDNLPTLMDMEDDDPAAARRARAFWNQFDELGDRIQFICSARDDQQYDRLRKRLSDKFRDEVLVIRLKCITKEERESWVNGRYQRYLERDASVAEHKFIEEEAGLHPYLVELASYALVTAIKHDEIANLQRQPKKPGQDLLARFFRQARLTLDVPRRDFFGQLMAASAGELQTDLRNLSRAVARDDELSRLGDEISQLSKEKASDPNVNRRLKELAAAEDFRENLHRESLKNLEELGYLVNADQPKEVDFMSRPFWLYVQDYFRSLSPSGQVVEPKDLSISLLCSSLGRAEPPETECDRAQEYSKELAMIRTMLRSRGARVPTAQRPFSLDIKREFKDSFDQLINYRLHPTLYDVPGAFRDLEEVGNYILTQFTTVAIKKHLQELPLGSTILLMVDDMLKDIPWELMLETAYAGEIPFRVGRVVISPRESTPVRPAVRGTKKIKALLIADPTGDESPHLALARKEVQWLRNTLLRDDRFSAPDVLIGARHCQRIRLLNHLSSGEYGLVHYSGHTFYDGERSAWKLSDGVITTDQLTNAVQMAPPALVFSASCESAEASAARPIEYEGQAFDLPSSYLQAGVEAYIGTLWNVYEDSTMKFVQEFYSAFLSSEYNLGECMRLAKWALKKSGARRERVHWLAYVLYGDPHTTPGDLFPALRSRRN